MHHVRFGDTPVTPSKIVCIGRNYVSHIRELGNEVPDEMVVFCKPNSAIGTELRAEHGGEALHYEGEIALLVQGGRFAGAGFGLDLTKRRLQSRLKKNGLPWERAKAFDGAALFSPFQPLSGDVAGLALELDVDSTPRQRGDVGLMLYPPATILAELQRFMTLEDGDIIMTGTPSGVGELRAGERFHGRVLHGGAVLAASEWHVSWAGQSATPFPESIVIRALVHVFPGFLSTPVSPPHSLQASNTAHGARTCVWSKCQR